MYLSAPFAAVPYAGAFASAPDLDAMLSSSDQLVYTVELGAWDIDADTLTTLYFASSEFASQPTDTPPNESFDGRLLTALQFRRSTIDGDRVGVNFSAGEGTITLSNSDGGLDDYVSDFAIDGRPVVVRLGRVTDPLADHMIVFRGFAVDIFADQDQATVTVRDRGMLLDEPTQPTLYTGAGNAEGDSNLEGKRKQISIGTTNGVPFTLVDSSESIYQFHDSGTIALDCSISVVYDRGTPLTLDTAVADYTALVSEAPSPGEFSSSADGFMRLGRAPDGVLFGTCSALIAGAGGTPGLVDIIGLFLPIADVTDNLIDQGTFDAVRVAYADDFSLVIEATESLSIGDAIDEIMAGIGGWGGFNRRGRLALGIVDPADASVPIAAYFRRDEGDIISLDRERMPAGVWPPPWRRRVSWGNNATVFKDFAGGVTNAVREFYAEPYRISEASDAGILTDHLLAQDPPPVETHMEDEADATAEATRLLDLYAGGYQLYRMVVSRRGLLCDIGHRIHVTHPRYGLAAGKAGVIVEMEDRLQIHGSDVDQVEIVWIG